MKVDWNAVKAQVAVFVCLLVDLYVYASMYIRRFGNYVVVGALKLQTRLESPDSAARVMYAYSYVLSQGNCVNVVDDLTTYTKQYFRTHTEYNSNELNSFLENFGYKKLSSAAPIYLTIGFLSKGSVWELTFDLHDGSLRLKGGETKELLFGEINLRELLGVRTSPSKEE